MTYQVLIIEDDKGTIKTLSKILERNGLKADAALNIRDGLNRIAENDYEVVLLDVNLPDGNGIESISTILEHPFPPQVIIMTGYSDSDGAQLSIESGAWDYLQKPISPDDLKLQVARALQYRTQKRNSVSRARLKAPHIIGSSKALQASLEQAGQIVNSDGNLLITGDTGTGKEMFARAIHKNTARRNGAFVVADCSVLSENLVESVLFGHEKGAFTGAEKSRKGLFALANGGTLFMDEVGELPGSIQSSFLRVLQEKSFRPIGSEKEVYSDFRVICATNKNLDTLVEKKIFRADLLYRLKTFVLKLPPLKEREGDISVIAAHQVKKCCHAHGVPNKAISPDFIAVIEKYGWPGNVRELLNAIETSVTAAQFEDTLFAVHLPVKIRAEAAASNIKPVPPQKDTMPSLPFESFTHKELIENTERRYLESLYESTGGHIQTLLKLTALSRTVLYRKLKKYNIT